MHENVCAVCAMRAVPYLLTSAPQVHQPGAPEGPFHYRVWRFELKRVVRDSRRPVRTRPSTTQSPRPFRSLSFGPRDVCPSRVIRSHADTDRSHAGTRASLTATAAIPGDSGIKRPVSRIAPHVLRQKKGR